MFEVETRNEEVDDDRTASIGTGKNFRSTNPVNCAQDGDEAIRPSQSSSIKSDGFISLN